MIYINICVFTFPLVLQLPPLTNTNLINMYKTSIKHEIKLIPIHRPN